MVLGNGVILLRLVKTTGSLPGFGLFLGESLFDLLNSRAYTCSNNLI
jgi:hypothetical protein